MYFGNVQVCLDHCKRQVSQKKYVQGHYLKPKSAKTAYNTIGNIVFVKLILVCNNPNITLYIYTFYATCHYFYSCRLYVPWNCSTPQKKM